jgi:uncharacterized repeat protein (TIGR02543 family)
MGYLDKYKGDYERSIYDILSLDPQKDWAALKANYVATDIEKVKIGGNTFTNYGDFQFAWEKSYNESPERSVGGVIDNLNSQTTFVTPHLILNFAVMSIDDYRKIMRLDLEQNEFVVECYDPIYNKKFEGKMYFATPQMAKLFKLAKIRFDSGRWEEFVELVGVQEYTVELIGTNADLDSVSVRYIVNPPVGETPSVENGDENDVYKGEEVVIGSNTDIPTETFGGDYKFKHWVDEQGVVYTNGYAYTINDNLVLYAQWEATTNHTLTFNYGLADPVINESSYSYETSRTVVQGKSIGNLPIADVPSVKIKKGDKTETYYPYHSGAWYKTPIKAENSVSLTDGTPYWLNKDTSIYLLFETYSYGLNLYLDGVLYQSNSIQYNTPMNLPYLVKEGKTLDGWYTTSDFQSGTKVSGNMPPYNLTLYARWVDK